MSGALAALFPPGVVVVEAGPGDEDEARLAPEEARWLAPMAPARRREFTLGRNAARRALAALGHPATGIGRHADDRDPVWPQGIVGSISHSHGEAAAACARRSPALRGVGLDLERAGALAPDVADHVCRPDELAALAAHAPPPGGWPLLLFVVKESAYKAWFPATRAPLEFHAMTVALDVTARTFRARVDHPAAAALAAEGLAVRGAWLADGRRVAAGAVLAPEG